MNWETLNSPLAITIVSFLLGGILASTVSAMWQRRSQRYAVRLQLMQDVLKTYHDYMRFLRREDSVNDKIEFDHLHAEMISKAKVARILFGGSIGDDLLTLGQKMATVQALRNEGRTEKAETKRQEIYEEADRIVESFYFRV